MASSPQFPNVAIGELLWDLLPTGARLGGTTTNFAVLSARLGEFAALASCLGRDGLGHEAMKRLRLLAEEPVTAEPATLPAAEPGPKTHLDLSCVQTSKELPTGTVEVTLDGQGRPQYEIVTPVAWDAITLSPTLLELAARASVICFGTLAQRHAVSRETIRAFIAAARPECVLVCDLNLRKPFCDAEVLRWCLAHADVIKVSDEELPEVGRLLGEPCLTAGLPHTKGPDLTRAAEGAAATILRLATQCRFVAITLGPHGSFVADRQCTHRHEGFAVTVVDTIGAGDAFTAGMVHAYMQGASLAKVNEVANRCGSYVASQPGATPELSASLLESIRATLSGDRLS